MGWALSNFFWDFWNFFNFAKPLTRFAMILFLVVKQSTVGQIRNGNVLLKTTGCERGPPTIAHDSSYHVVDDLP